jgi:hypothetical protein
MANKLLSSSIVLLFIPLALHAQSAAIDLSQFISLGGIFLAALLALSILAVVAVIVIGAVTLGTNRPRGLAMIAGGLFGALVIGVTVAWVSSLSGHTVQIS